VTVSYIQSLCRFYEMGVFVFEGRLVYVVSDVDLNLQDCRLCASRAIRTRECTAMKTSSLLVLPVKAN